jgi:hypothetical protein
MEEEGSLLHRGKCAMGVCLSALLQGWSWRMRRAQMVQLDGMQVQHLATLAEAAAAGGGGAVIGPSRAIEQPPLAGSAATAPPAGFDHQLASHKAQDSSRRWCLQGGDDTEPSRDQEGDPGIDSSSSSSKGSAHQEGVDNSDSCSRAGTGSTPELRHTVLWPLLPGGWSGIEMKYGANHSNLSNTVHAASPPEAISSSSSIGGATGTGTATSNMEPAVVLSQPTLQQLRVVLEGCVWEHQAGRLGGMWSGLLLLVILLSSAPRTVRLTFLAGVPGEVLLRLLTDVAAGGTALDASRAQAGMAGPKGCLDDAVGAFMEWHTQAAGCGALVFSDVLAGLSRAGDVIPTRQAVLQVLLWCFFEVVPPQQQQQQATDGSGTSSSHGASSGEHAAALQLAAQQGALWASSQGEAPALQAKLPPPCLPVAWHPAAYMCVPVLHRHAGSPPPAINGHATCIKTA